MRNPKDTVCSYYPYVKKRGGLQADITWKTFFTNFLEGNGEFVMKLK